MSVAQAQSPRRVSIALPGPDEIIEGLSWILLGIAPLLINVYNVDAYRTVQATTSTMLLLVMVATWVVKVTLDGRWPSLRRMPLWPAVAGFFAWVGLTGALQTPSLPLTGLSVLNLALYIGWAFVVADLGARVPGFLWRLLLPIGFAFLFNNITAVLQHRGFLFQGATQDGYTGLYALWPFKGQGASNYFAGLQAPSRLGSAAGTLGNQNVLGGYLTATVPLFTLLPLVVLARWQELCRWCARTWPKLGSEGAKVPVAALFGFLFLNAGLAFASLLATDTRGAWLGVAGTFVVGLLVVPAFFRKRIEQVPARQRAGLGVGLLAFVVLLTGLAFSAGVTPKMLQDKLSNTWTIKQRLVAWQVAAEMAKDEPVVGQGVGTYKMHYFKFLARHFNGQPVPVYMHHRYVQAHNDFIQLAGEAGWTGLLLGLGVLGFFWVGIPRWLWRRQPGASEALLVLGAGLGTLGMGVFAISGFPFHIAASSSVFATLVGIVLAPQWRERLDALPAASAPSDGEGPTPDEPGLPAATSEAPAAQTVTGTPAWIASGVVAGLALSFGMGVLRHYESDMLTKAGMDLYKQGDYQTALGRLESAVASDPERGDARLVLGILYMMTRRCTQAEEQFLRAQTSYDDVTLHYYMGRLYEGLSRREEARREYRRARSYFPEGEEVRKAVDRRLALLESGRPDPAAVAACSPPASSSASR
ncbi:MAG: O-antigen ligase family protein [Candidatus Sericytochromatia bacterium]|nr:O-antigen ligase family protein [Candidatus Sericytochromatia bacterium]